MADLLYDDISTPVIKSFDDLIIEFDISYKNRRKHIYLLENIINCGILDNFEGQNFDTFDIFSYNLILAPEVACYAYGIMSNKIPPERNQNFGEGTFEDFCDKSRNFKCTIESQLRSFYFKLFHKAIAFNSFSS